MHRIKKYFTRCASHYNVPQAKGLALKKAYRKGENYGRDIEQDC